MWKDPIHSEEIMAMNIYSPSNAVTFLKKHKLQKTQWEINTVIIGDFNTSLSKIDEEKKLSKDIYSLYNAISKADLIDTHQKNIPSSQVHMNHSVNLTIYEVTTKLLFHKGKSIPRLWL